MSKPLISIIIPVFNDGPYIARALDSCVNQTFSDIEIVVVDDASTDKTPDIIAEYTKKDSRIKALRHDKNKKTLQAIKTAVLAASGEYIMIISGDDTFELNAAETCAKAIHKNPGVDIVHFGRRNLDKDGKETAVLLPKKSKLKDREILEHLFSLTEGSRATHQVRKRSIVTEIYKQLNPKKDLVLGEDQVVAFLYALRAKKYVGIKDILYNYNVSAGMLYNPNVDLDYFLGYRIKLADSIDELEKQLKAIEVEKWVWPHFLALKRRQYAAMVLAAQHLSEKDRFIALKVWTERTSAVDTLIGLATKTPQLFLEEYLDFLDKYNPTGFDMGSCRELVGSLTDSFLLQVEHNNIQNNNKLKNMRAENRYLKSELDSHLGIKRSAKLLVGNIKRRLFSNRLGRLVLGLGIISWIKSAFRWGKNKEDERYYELQKQLISKVKKIPNKDNPKYIISLTTYGKRLRTHAPSAVASLMSQSKLPDKIILWLGYSEKIPRSIKRLRRRGLEVRFCEDIGAYTKLIPTLREFPKANITTADDDIIYPTDWYEKLYDTHKRHPKKIISHRVHEIKVKDGKILPYNDWIFATAKAVNAENIFPTGVGGVLYPAGVLPEETTNQEEFMELSSNNDDIWYWAMARLAGVDYVIVEDGYRDTVKMAINPENDDGLWASQNAMGGNDKSIKKITKRYPEIITKLKR